MSCANRPLLIDALCDGADPGPPGRALLDIIAMTARWRLRLWLASDDDLLRVVRDALATGTISHHALDQLAPNRRVEHLRRQLIAAGMVPDRHHQLWLFDRWLNEFLPTITDNHHRQNVTAYATWHHRRRIARDVDAGTLRVSSPRAARRHIRAAANFLEFLAQHQRTLAGCRQIDIDDWLSSGPSTRRSTITFITWARTQRLCPRNLVVPNYAKHVPDEMPHNDRAALIGRLLHDPDITLTDRVAGLLVAVYAQPVTRITRLRRSDVLDLDGTLGIRLGDEVLTLDDSIANHIRQLGDRRHPDDWLFQGGTPGQPTSAHGLAERLRALGITKAARYAAFHDLIAHVPSPLLADVLGYNPVVTATRAEALATTWNTYAALRSEPAPEPAAFPPQPLATTGTSDHICRHG